MITLSLLKNAGNKAFPFFVNIVSSLLFFTEVFAFTYHIYFKSVNPIFWYTSNGYDHLLTVFALIFLFTFVLIKSKSKYSGLEALGSVMFVDGIASICAGFFVLHWEDNEFEGTTIAMIGLIILILINRNMTIQYGLWLAFEMIFWGLWEAFKIPAVYYIKNNSIVYGIYFWNIPLNIWIISAWYLQVIVFLLFYRITYKYY